MSKRAWGPTEMARQANAFLPEGQTIAPASISHYCSGRAMPRPRQLEAISRALGITPADLGLDWELSGPLDLARRERSTEASHRAASKLLIEDLGHGNVRLQIDQEFSWDTAMKILECLRVEPSR